jgi:hypothetical protein
VSTAHLGRCRTRGAFEQGDGAASARIKGRSRPTAARRVSHEQLWDEERRNYRAAENPIWIVDLKIVRLETIPTGTATDLVGASPVHARIRALRANNRNQEHDRCGSNEFVDFSRIATASRTCGLRLEDKKLAQLTSFSDFDVKALDAASTARDCLRAAGNIHLMRRAERRRREHHGGR